MRGREPVKSTLKYSNRERVPMLYFNRDKEKSDMVMIDVCPVSYQTCVSAFEKYGDYKKRRNADEGH